MRIITGLLKGHKIQIPKRLDVRPTTDRVKESMFSVIEARWYLQDSAVLDLFAGSGNLGFEALSRARAKFILLIITPKISTLLKTGEKFEMSSQIRTVTLDVKRFLDGPPIPAEIIFCDPPYKFQGIEEIVEKILLNGWLQSKGWLVLEHNKYHDFSGQKNCFQIKNTAAHLSVFLVKT